MKSSRRKRALWPLLAVAAVLGLVLVVLATERRGSHGVAGRVQRDAVGPAGATSPGLPAPLPVRASEPLPLAPPAARREGAAHEAALPPADEDARGDLLLVGRVVDETGVALPGAQLWFHPSHAAREAAGLAVDHVAPVAWHALPHGVADEQGRFELLVPAALVDPASWPVSPRAVLPSQLPWHPLLLVSAPGRRATAHVLAGLAGSGEGGRVPARHDAGDVVPAPGAVVTARVVDEAGRPLAGARLAVVREHVPFPERPEWHLVRELMDAVADARGHLRADRCLAGTATIVVQHAGFVPARRQVELAEGEISDLGEIVLGAGRALFGVVVGPDGDPLPDATVELLGEDVASGEDDDLVLFRFFSSGRRPSPGDLRVRTDARGAFAFDTLEQQSYCLLAGADGHEPVRVPDVKAGGPPLEVVLPVAELLVVRAVDGATGEPVAGASGRVLRLAAVPSAEELAEGRVPVAPLAVLTGVEAAARLPGDVAPDGLLVASPAGGVAHHVAVHAEGYGETAALLPGVAPGERHEHVLRLLPPARVRGEVVDPDGAPWPGVKVSAEREESPFHDELDVETVTDAGGRFVIDGLSPGVWTIYPYRPDLLGNLAEEVELGPGEERGGLRFVREAGATLRGLVLDAGGRPATFHEVRAQHLSPGLTGLVGQNLRTDEHGRFAFLGLRPLRTRVSAFPAAEVVVDLVLGENPEIELRLDHAARLHGRLLDALGSPAPDGTVLLQDGGSAWNRRTARTDEAGGFAFEDLGEGESVLSAVSRAGAVSEPQLVSLRWGESTWVEVRLGGATLAVRVCDARGEPLPGTPVEVLDADWADTAPEPVRRWPWRRSAHTDEEGRLRLSGLPAGPYRVQVARGEVPLDAEPLAWAGHDLPETEVRAPSAAAPR